MKYLLITLSALVLVNGLALIVRGLINIMSLPDYSRAIFGILEFAIGASTLIMGLVWVRKAYDEY